MPRLHEEPVRAGVPFAAYREALGKQRGRAVRLGPPEIAGSFEQPLPGVRRDGVERDRVRLAGTERDVKICQSRSRFRRRPRSKRRAARADAHAGKPRDFRPRKR